MTFFIYATLLLLAAVCGIVIFRGFLRWRDHVHEATSSGRRAKKKTSSSRHPERDNSHAYLKALRSNNPEEMVKAPLPKHFSEELLLQALLRIQNQPSLYDLFLERLTEQFTIGQYERLVSTWTRYCNSLGEGMASQNAFLRQLSERLTVHLETQERSASLEVDIDDENLRGSRVRHERWQLWEPHQKQKTPRDEAQEEILSREEQKKRIQEEIGTKEAQLAELDENSSRAELLKDDLSKLDGLLREVNKKIFSLRKQHGI